MSKGPRLSIGRSGPLLLPVVHETEQSLRDTCAGASAVAARGPRARPENRTARVRRRHEPPAGWIFASGQGQPSWPPCVGGARSGL
jgi:hypothetical protein